MSSNSLTPNAADPFSRFMAAMFDEKQVISVPTGFQAFFGRPETGAMTLFSPDANVVDIDIIRGNKKTSALIPRGMVSRPLGAIQENLNVENFTSFSRKYPLSEEEGDITADQILFRVAGESPYAGQTRLDRMRMLGLKIHMESIRRTVRMFEVLAAQSVLEGVQDAILGTTNTDLQYDFKRNATHIGDVSVTWDNADAVIMADIDGACDKLEANGNVSPNFIGIGGEAMDALIKDDVIQNLADNRRYELVEVSLANPVPPEFARFIASGWIARGRLRTPKGYNLWMFTYNRTYDSAAGTSTKIMPEDQAFITSVDARCDRYFGPSEVLPMLSSRVELYRDLFGFDPTMPPMPPNILGDGAIIDPAMFYCDAYASNDWKKVTVRTQSAPIFATTQTDAFVTLTGLIA